MRGWEGRAEEAAGGSTGEGLVARGCARESSNPPPSSHGARESGCGHVKDEWVGRSFRSGCSLRCAHRGGGRQREGEGGVVGTGFFNTFTKEIRRNQKVIARNQKESKKIIRN